MTWKTAGIGDLDGTAKIKATAKVDNLVSFNIECAVCGTPCIFTVPVIKIPVSIDMPPCPISAALLAAGSADFTLPDTTPVAVKVSAKGSGSVTDDKGNELGALTFAVTVSPK